jgi:(2Fe-2S) ferredoxin
VVVIYPEGTWYVKVTPADVPEILGAMVEGRTVDRLRHPRQSSA